MGDPATLKALLERVKSATGPGRRLDAELLCALAAPPGAYVEQSLLNGVWCIYDGEDTQGRKRPWEKREWHRPNGWALTDSLDAALALVERVMPPKCAIDLERNVHTGLWATEFVWRFRDAGGWVEVRSEKHPTPALALLAALLEAKIMEAESD